jgi:hypothetical protein
MRGALLLVTLKSTHESLSNSCKIIAETSYAEESPRNRRASNKIWSLRILPLPLLSLTPIFWFAAPEIQSVKFSQKSRMKYVVMATAVTWSHAKYKMTHPSCQPREVLRPRRPNWAKLSNLSTRQKKGQLAICQDTNHKMENDSHLHMTLSLRHAQPPPMKNMASLQLLKIERVNNNEQAPGCLRSGIKKANDSSC